MNISISNLEKMANTFAAKLIKSGYEVSVEANKMGAFYHSYVQFTVTTPNGSYYSFDILANGYDAVGKRQVSTYYGWTAAKSQILAVIQSA